MNGSRKEVSIHQFILRCDGIPSHKGNICLQIGILCFPSQIICKLQLGALLVSLCKGRKQDGVTIGQWTCGIVIDTPSRELPDNM